MSSSVPWRFMPAGLLAFCLAAAPVAAAPIIPAGSLAIGLAPGGTVTSNSPGNALLSTSTVTVNGSRVVVSTMPVTPGGYDLGISTGDAMSVLTSGIYGDGTYSQSTYLEVSIDGLVFEYTRLLAQFIVNGSNSFQTFSFFGVMDPGTNSSTSQQYVGASSSLSFSLGQAGTGGSISYGVTLDTPMPEPATPGILAVGFMALGLIRRRWQH